MLQHLRKALGLRCIKHLSRSTILFSSFINLQDISFVLTIYLRATCVNLTTNRSLRDIPTLSVCVHTEKTLWMMPLLFKLALCWGESPSGWLCINSAFTSKQLQTAKAPFQSLTLHHVHLKPCTHVSWCQGCHFQSTTCTMFELILAFLPSCLELHIPQLQNTLNSV